MKRFIATLLLVCSCATQEAYIPSGPNESNFAFQGEMMRSGKAYTDVMELLATEDTSLSDVQKRMAYVARVAAMITTGIWLAEHMSPTDQRTTKATVGMAFQAAKLAEAAEQARTSTAASSNTSTTSMYNVQGKPLARL